MTNTQYRHADKTMNYHSQLAKRLGRVLLWIGLATSATSITTLTSLAVAGNPTVKIGSTVTVRVLSAKVMKAAKFIGPSAASVSRGEQLRVVATKGDWFSVTGNFAGTGWIHRSSVENRAVALSSKPGGTGSGTASSDEIELAGRGFTPQVESQYRQKNPNLDFAHVDGIEAITLDGSELQAFVDEGGLVGADPNAAAAAAPPSVPTPKKPATKGSK
ncbi:MAG: hypothetical protein KBG15_02725 [Kofleriaceae bacterium]|nr:hypothetical protein [Kofleriaceae bacterium]